MELNGSMEGAYNDANEKCTWKRAKRKKETDRESEGFLNRFDVVDIVAFNTELWQFSVWRRIKFEDKTSKCKSTTGKQCVRCCVHHGIWNVKQLSTIVNSLYSFISWTSFPGTAQPSQDAFSLMKGIAQHFAVAFRPS